MREGVIADFRYRRRNDQTFHPQGAQALDLLKARRSSSASPRRDPGGKRAIRQSVLAAGARRAGLIAEPIAAAIGAGMPITDPTGNMVVDIGGGTTEVAVLSLAISSMPAPSASAATGWTKRSSATCAASKTCWSAKHRRADQDLHRHRADARRRPRHLDAIRGRDLLNGVPKETEIIQAQVAEALSEPVQQICEAVMTALEATPPDLAADIVDRGVMLTGGGALLGDLDLALREQTGLAVSVADEASIALPLAPARRWSLKTTGHAIDYDS